MSKRKVLIIANDDLAVYKCRKELVCSLVRDFDVYLSLKEFKWSDYFRSIGCTVFPTEVDRNGTNFFKDLRLIFGYKKIQRKVKPDIILTFNIKPNIYGNLFLDESRVISIVNITGLGKGLECSGFLSKLNILLYKAAMRNVRWIFFQNQENLEFFKKNRISDISKYMLVPGSGVNLEEYYALEYPNSDDVIHFLFIGRVIKEKGIDEYLEAAKIIKKSHNNVIFHVLGFCEDDYYRQKMESYEGMEIISYEGMQEDTIRFQKISHCTVHPSYYPEGMSNACLESAACARPVITSDKSGCRETVDDGSTGFIVKQRSVEDLVVKIEKFISMSNDQKREMGLRGRKKMEREFDRDRVVDFYLSRINL